MKHSTQYLIFVSAVIVVFALAGCSHVHTTQRPTVSDAVTEVISASEMLDDDHLDKEPSLVLAGHPNITSSVVRSPSRRALHEPIKEPAVQRAQGHALRAVDTLDVRPAHEQLPDKRATRKRERSNVTSQRYHTVLVGDALEDILGSQNTTREPTVRDAVVEIIPAVEITGDDYMTEEPRDK